MSEHSLLVEAGLARDGGDGRSAVTAIPRRRRPAWSRGGWRPLDPDVVLDHLAAAGPGALVLARPAPVDPGAACLAPLARLRGLEVVALPFEVEAARWTVALAGLWAAAGHPALARALSVVHGLWQAPLRLPRREAAPGEPALPAVRPAVLARWAVWAWRPCRWCPGGGLPGRACPRCGAACVDPPAAVSGRGTLAAA